MVPDFYRRWMLRLQSFLAAAPRPPRRAQTRRRGFS
jgi:hypothetical protein